MQDGDVPGFIKSLGLPGLIDVHVHFYPQRMIEKVWAYFDSTYWHITYRGDEAERIAQLETLGVKRFPALTYAHKPGMAADLNRWATEFALSNPQNLRSATFFPEPSALSYVDIHHTDIFKVHVQVGAFDPRDELLDPVWGLIAEAGTPVITHAGSGPLPGKHTGPGPLAEVLARHPRLNLIIAHMGTPEYGEFLALAEKYERVSLDTTMAFTDFVEAIAPYPRELLERVKDLGLAGKVLLGSDFPNIPYPYAHQLDALVKLDLGDDWLKAVCWNNAAALFNEPFA